MHVLRFGSYINIFDDGSEELDAYKAFLKEFDGNLDSLSVNEVPHHVDRPWFKIEDLFRLIYDPSSSVDYAVYTIARIPYKYDDMVKAYPGRGAISYSLMSALGKIKGFKSVAAMKNTLLVVLKHCSSVYSFYFTYVDPDLHMSQSLRDFVWIIQGSFRGPSALRKLFKCSRHHDKAGKPTGEVVLSLSLDLTSRNWAVATNRRIGLSFAPKFEQLAITMVGGHRPLPKNVVGLPSDHPYVRAPCGMLYYSDIAV
jgi:hypothetical protein